MINEHSHSALNWIVYLMQHDCSHFVY